MAEYVISVSDSLNLFEAEYENVVTNLMYYGSVREADIYLFSKFQWKNLITEEKKMYLTLATRQIDKLQYTQTKTGVLEFPRGTQTEVPDNVKYACYEIALEFAKGFDPDQEVRSAQVQSSSYMSRKTTYRPNRVPDYILAGIPNMTAWGYLRPYLVVPGTVELIRVC